MTAADPLRAAIPENSDRAGALRLKTLIEAFWYARGYRVPVHIEEQGFNMRMRSSRYDVRSPLVNGLPLPCHRIEDAA